MKKILLITFGVIAVLLVALRLALPTLTKEAIIYGVESATPYKAEVGDVSYDVYEGKAALRDVTLRLKDAVELNIKSFDFDLIWQPLLEGTAAIDNVRLAGVTTRALMDKERLEVAGYDLNAAPSEGAGEAESSTKAEEEKAAKAVESDGDKSGDGTLPVIINAIAIDDTVVNFVGEDGRKATFTVEALRVSAIDLRHKDKPAKVDAKLKIDKSPLNLKGEVYPLDPSQTSAMAFAMTKVNIGKLLALVASKVPEGMSVKGLATTDLNTTFAIADDAEGTIDLTAKGLVRLAAVDFRQPDLTAKFKQLDVNLDNAVTLKGERYNVTGPAKIDLAQLAFVGKDGLSVAAESIKIAQKLGVDPDRIAADGTIKIKELGYGKEPTRAKVASIDLQTVAGMKGDAPSGTVSGVISGIVVHEDPVPDSEKGVKGKKTSGKKKTAKGKSPTKPTAEEPTFQAKAVTLKQVKLGSVEPLKVTAQRILLDDFVLAYPYKNPGIDYDPSVIDLSQLNLTLDRFNDGSAAGIPGKLAFDTKIGKTGKISIKGQSKSKAVDKTTLTMSGDIDAVDLTDLSGFFMQQMGYRIERGSLNSKFKVAKNTKDDLKGNVKILLAKLQVNDKDRRGKTLKNRSSVPLASSLSMTKDDSDNLPLEFPITGNLNSPSFSPRILLTEKLSEILVDQLTQSLGTAIVSNYLPMLASSATMSPVLVYSLLKKGVDVATKLRFEPVTFGKDSVIPTRKGAKVLSTVAKNLSQRPNLILKFCTKAYYAEGPGSTGQQKGAKLNEAQVKKAFALADKRLAYVRRTLRRTPKIKAKQIVTCKPSLEPKAVPVPELEIAI